MQKSSLKQPRLPKFSAIKSARIVPTIQQILSNNRKKLQHLLEQTHFTWENLMEPLDDLEETLSQAWSPIAHLNAVKNEPALHEAYSTCITLLSDYSTEIAQNEHLYRAIKSIADSDTFHTLDKAQQKVIQNNLRDFRLEGAELNAKDKKTFRHIKQQLTKLSNQFEHHVLQATNRWQRLITDPALLKGIPEHTLTATAQKARALKKQGHCLTLDFPTYHAVLLYAENRALRQQIHEAYVTRASDLGEKKFDNTKIMEEILFLRHQQAKLLGFNNFAEYSLATKMAKEPSAVLSFLNDLAKRTRPFAKKEIAALKKFAFETDGLDELKTWDIAYYTEKLRLARFNLSQETLRAYFPIQQVLKGLFFIIQKLYGMTVRERFDIDIWDDEVRFFEISDERQLRGQLYMDLFARPNKRDGAWMDEYCVRRRHHHEIQTPVAYVTCNFTPPSAGQPALLTHDEVLTLFHEMGHALHHLLTQVDYADISGINGVPWDAVELPSQFFENWCWNKLPLSHLTKHYLTQKKLPTKLLEQLLAAKNFQAALQMLRQIEFALFDFRIHLEYQPKQPNFIQTLLDAVRHDVSVIDIPSFNRFQHSFTHIFSGGYAAGYYSYKWAEVLSSDAFSLFEETHIFDKKIGKSFLEHILAVGGSIEPMDAFVAFRGRKPDIRALLRHSGIGETRAARKQ